MNPFYNTLRRIVFFVGDTKWTKSFPFFSCGREEPYIDLNEVDYAKTFLRIGDIILHREKRCWSNAAIGGAMIHAGIYVGDMQLVEAISEGVQKRNAGHILHSDWAIILRPNFESSLTREVAINEAIDWANRIVDFPYDVLFEFCSEADQKLVMEHGKGAIKHGVKFCCTEIAHFCYFKYLKELNVHRRRNISFLTWLISLPGLHPGKMVVDADMYIKGNFDVIWCSKRFTAQWAEKMKCEKKYVDKIAKYWATK
jgi:hypothetical protein